MNRCAPILLGPILLMAVTACGPAANAGATTPSLPVAATTRAIPSASASESAAEGRILAEPCLSLRSGPQTAATQILCIPTGTIVPISCATSGTSVAGPYGTSTIWDHTTYRSESGYVPDALVYTGEDVPAAAPCSTSTTTVANGHVIISPCAKMRTAPRTAATVVICVPNNTMIDIDCTTTGTSVTGQYGATTVWDHTTYKGKSGYLSDADVFTGQAAPIAGKC